MVVVRMVSEKENLLFFWILRLTMTSEFIFFRIQMTWRCRWRGGEASDQKNQTVPTLLHLHIIGGGASEAIFAKFRRSQDDGRINNVFSRRRIDVFWIPPDVPVYVCTHTTATYAIRKCEGGGWKQSMNRWARQWLGIGAHLLNFQRFRRKNRFFLPIRPAKLRRFEVCAFKFRVTVADERDLILSDFQWIFGGFFGVFDRFNSFIFGKRLGKWKILKIWLKIKKNEIFSKFERKFRFFSFFFLNFYSIFILFLFRINWKKICTKIELKNLFFWNFPKKWVSLRKSSDLQ